MCACAVKKKKRKRKKSYKLTRWLHWVAVVISKLTRRDEQEEEREPLLLLPFLPRCMMVAVMVKAAAVRPVVLLPLPPVFPWWSREETPVAVLHTTGSTDATELLARSSSRFTEPEAKLASYRSTCKLSLTTISFSISSLFFFGRDRRCSEPWPVSRCVFELSASWMRRCLDETDWPPVHLPGVVLARRVFWMFGVLIRQTSSLFLLL